MSNPVEIVIRAVDAFSPAFAGLDTALRRTEGSGRQAQGALAGVGASFVLVAQAGEGARSAVEDFAAGTGERLAALDAERQAARAELATQQEDATQRLHERLLALDRAAATRRAAQREAAFAHEREVTAAHDAALIAMEQQTQGSLLALDERITALRLETARRRLDELQALAEGHGGALARTAKALAVAEALVAAYLAGNKALAAVPFPFNLAAAAAVTAQGLATVERIRNVNVAHGGVESVPEDATFLLQRGERVLSARQNRDLTRFLEAAPNSGAAPGGGVVIENLTIHVLENATAAQALLSMERAELRQVVSERLIPMLDELARLGIRPHFVEENT